MKCNLLLCSKDDGLNQASNASTGNLDIGVYERVWWTELEDSTPMHIVVEHMLQFLWSDAAHSISVHGPQIGDIVVAGDRAVMLYSNVADNMFDDYSVVPAWPDWVFATITCPKGVGEIPLWRSEDGPLGRQDVGE